MCMCSQERRVTVGNTNATYKPFYRHYTGRLWEGKKFDSSYDRGEPLPLKLGAGAVIAGWEQGLRDMCIGEKRKLQIPPELGYGSMNLGDIIPPDSTLVFDVELVDINGQSAYVQPESHEDL